MIRPPYRIFACSVLPGVAIPETVLTQEEYSSLALRQQSEAIAASGSPGSPIQWVDVSSHESCWPIPKKGDILTWADPDEALTSISKIVIKNIKCNRDSDVVLIEDINGDSIEAFWSELEYA